MNEPRYIRFKKLATAENPECPTPLAEDHDYGGITAGVPVEYEVTGWLPYDIEVGYRVTIHRESRNGVKTPGRMTTSPVTSIDLKDNGLVVRTMNSVYELEWL